MSGEAALAGSSSRYLKSDEDERRKNPEARRSPKTRGYPKTKKLQKVETAGAITESEGLDGRR